MITVHAQDAHPDENIAPFAHQTPDGYALAGVSGYHAGGTTVLCNDCITFDDWQDPYPFMTGESDFPGTFCDDCSRVLPQSLLVYESGPGHYVYDFYYVMKNRPTLTVTDPDGNVQEINDYWFEDLQINYPSHTNIPTMSADEFTEFCHEWVEYQEGDK